MMVLTRCAVGSSSHGGRGRGTSFYHIRVPGVLEFQGEALFSTVSEMDSAKKLEIVRSLSSVL